MLLYFNWHIRIVTNFFFFFFRHYKFFVVVVVVNSMGFNRYVFVYTGITPYANLYHYDLPQALEKKYLGLLNDQVV